MLGKLFYLIKYPPLVTNMHIAFLHIQQTYTYICICTFYIDDRVYIYIYIPEY